MNRNEMEKNKYRKAEQKDEVDGLVNSVVGGQCRYCNCDL